MSVLLQAVGDAFNEGLYEEQARLRGIPLLESRPKYEMRKMTAKEVCGTRKVNIVPVIRGIWFQHIWAHNCSSNRILKKV